MERGAAGALGGVLTAERLHGVLRRAVGDGWALVGSDVRPASQGLSGFLGDHFRVTLDVRVGECDRRVDLFVKSLPRTNEPKAKFIDENDYYRREKIMFQLFETMRAPTDGETQWCAQAYMYDDDIVVMPDLLCRGFRQRPPLDCLDLQHALLVAASLARFHAASANHDTERMLGGREPFGREHADLLKEPTFRDSPWLRAAAKLTRDFLAAFSERSSELPADLEEVLLRLYSRACDSLTESDGLNVVLHKDLWVNNIMFKYEGGAPVSALLIDFQCVRYGPPAFDLMIFLYLNTSRGFRRKYEATMFRHYYVIFSENVDEETKRRLQSTGYDFDAFVGWCHRARTFGMLESLALFPYVLMEPGAARRTFDDPATFVRLCDEDRSAPVLAHARACAAYRRRQLEVGEEFLDRYVCGSADTFV